MSDWHDFASCHDCAWRFDTFAEPDSTTKNSVPGKVAEKHLEATGHAVAFGMHLMTRCGEDCERRKGDA